MATNDNGLAVAARISTRMRSLLIVRLDTEAELAAALACPADALLLDLRCAVGDARATARGLALEALRGRRQRMFVRVDRLDGPEIEADLDAIMPGAPDGVLSPGAVGGADVQRLGAKLAVREALFARDDGATKILAIATESAEAVFGLASYAGCSRRLEALGFEAEALGAEVRARVLRGPDGEWIGPVRHARDALLLAAATAEVFAIDAPSSPSRGEAEFLREARAAWRDGFAAKMAAHPDQVAAIHEIFG